MISTWLVSATKRLPDGGLQSGELVVKIEDATGEIVGPIAVEGLSNEYGKPQPSEFEG